MLPQERTTGLGCIPEGRSVIYQCTVYDSISIASTIWRGTPSAFSCPAVSSLIVLPHVNFELGVSATCGNLTAMSVGVSGSEYISRLTLTATTKLKKAVINCTLSGVVLIGSDTVSIGG